MSQNLPTISLLVSILSLLLALFTLLSKQHASLYAGYVFHVETNDGSMSMLHLCLENTGPGIAYDLNVQAGTFHTTIPRLDAGTDLVIPIRMNAPQPVQLHVTWKQGPLRLHTHHTRLGLADIPYSPRPLHRADYVIEDPQLVRLLERCANEQSGTMIRLTRRTKPHRRDQQKH